MPNSDDETADSARLTLTVADAARRSVARKTRWFGWCLVLVGILVSPATVASTGPPMLFMVIMAATLACLGAVEVLMWKQRMVPRGARGLYATAIAFWFVILVAVSVFLDSGDAWAVVAKVLASTPFFVIGVRALAFRHRQPTE